MSKSYLPGKEADLRDWLQNFDSVVQADAVALGVSEPQKTQLASLCTMYFNKYDAAREPGTRTPLAILERRAARAAVVANVRLLVRVIQANPAVTDIQRGELRITIRDVEPTPIPAPSTKAEIKVLYARGNLVTLRLRDEASDARSRPYGAAGAEVYLFIGPNAPEPLGAGWLPVALATRMTLDVKFAAADAGKQAKLVARWFSERGEFGPFGDLMELTIAGPMTAAA